MTKVGLHAIGKSTTLESNKSLFCQTHKASSCERYEVVKIRIEAEHTWPNGSVSPEREAYPGANSWGTLAWTCFTLPETQALAAQLRERTTAQASKSPLPGAREDAALASDRRHGAPSTQLSTAPLLLQQWPWCDARGCVMCPEGRERC
jgi:hypothetical protein